MPAPPVDTPVFLVRRAVDRSWVVQRVGGPAFDGQSKYRGPIPGHVALYTYAQSYRTKKEALERARHEQVHRPSVPIFTESR